MNPYMNWIGPAYFSSMGVPLIAGREFTHADGPASPKVAIINQTMARYFFGNENPLGRHFGFGRDKTADIEIVGVVADGKYSTLRERISRTV